MIGIGTVMACAENIDPNNDDSQYGYGRNLEYINFKPGGNGGSGAEVNNSAVTGYVWGENIGWIHLKNLAIPYNVKTVWAPLSTTPAPTTTVVALLSASPSPTEPPTAVELVSFKARANGGGSVTLAWETA